MGSALRVLVTGASGFVGAALVPALAGRGHEVRVYARGEALPGALAGCDAVVHLANLAHGGHGREALWRVNVEGTRALAEAAAAQGVRRLVYFSSVKAAAAQDGAPEDDYGASKRAAEHVLDGFAALGRLEPVVVRPPLVYGPGVKANFLALLGAIARGIPLPFAGLENRRSLVFVGNLCDAVGSFLEAPEVPGVPCTVSDGEPVAVADLCRRIGAALGRPARLFRVPRGMLAHVPGLRALTQSLEVDDGAARALGWKPRYSLDDGLRRTAAWYLHR
jgi:nucleoside-diphosphate-sugar epimerase